VSYKYIKTYFLCLHNATFRLVPRCLSSVRHIAQVASQTSNVLKVKLSIFSLLEPTEAMSKLSE